MKLESTGHPGDRVPRIACIGAGYWGKNLIRNFADLGALELICEVDARRRDAIASSFPSVRTCPSPDEALGEEIDGVVIATPAETHGALVRKALDAGKHVFVEKPLSLGVPEGEALVRRARDQSRILMVGHLLWYHPAVLELKRMVDEGALGRIQYVYSNRLNLGKIRREENILWSFAPHDISVILGLLQEMPDEVWARGGNYLHERIADVTTTHLSFPSGVQAHVFVSWLHPFKEQKLVVIGDRGMAVFNDTASDKLVFYPHRVDWKDTAPVTHKAEPVVVTVANDEPLRLECSAFLEAVRSGRPPRTDGEEALRVLTVLAAAQRHLDSPKPDLDGGSARRDRAGVFVHPSTEVDDGVEIGRGTKIWHFGHIMTGSRLGRDCRVGQNVVIGPRAVIGNNVKIQNNVSVYEGVILEDSVFCGPSMVFTNVYNPRSEIPRMSELRETRVRDGASLGANCTILCGATIGRYAFVGAGAVVLHDVPDYAVVVGNPGRFVGWMCRCGERVQLDERGRGGCVACSREYEQVSGRLQPMTSE